MKRLIYLIAGAILAGFGALVFVSPAPLGFALLIPGITLLIHGSNRFAAWVRIRRRRNLGINSQAVRFAAHAPEVVASALRRTDPHVGPRGPVDPGLR